MDEWQKHARDRHARRTAQEVAQWVRQQKALETRALNKALMEKKGVPKEEINHSHYDPAMCDVVYEMVMDGASHKKVAAALGVNVRTLYKWRKEYPDFAAAMSPVEEMTNEVEMSVFGKAKGYTYTAQKPMSVAGQIEIAEYEEHVAPDMTAARMWLQAHAPTKWSDKSMVAHEVGGLKDMLAAIGKEQSGIAALEALSDETGIPVTEAKQDVSGE